MSMMSRFIASLYKLPPAITYDVAVDKNIEIPVSDDVLLRADHYYPRHTEKLPTLLVRTPYGRSRLGMIWGTLFAERGFQVLIQSCRGTDDSDGEISPFRGEREDGLATLEWLKRQDWFDGRLVMTGNSYMGFTQWAIARDAGTMLKAFSTQVSSSEFQSAIHPGASFHLEIFLQWIQITESLKDSLLNYLKFMFTAGKRMKAAIFHLPLIDADEVLVGKSMTCWHEWLEHRDANDEWWQSDNYHHTISEITAPNHLVSGWYDFLLPQLLRDYAALEEGGRKPYLTIGPWSHSSNELVEVGLRESLLWLRAHVSGETDALRQSPVHLYVMGANEWRDLPAFPPNDTQNQHWYLQTDTNLSTELPSDSQPSYFRYDPADPTPNVGGATNATLGRGTGAQDNRKLEARSDVLVFTSEPLTRDVEVIGAVSADLYVSSSLEHTDFFVRLCDVYPDGKSMNVCDGIQRVLLAEDAPSDEKAHRVTVHLWATAYRFKEGHRIRIQVSSGAFPRFARNLGTGEALATATQMRIAEQHIYHDPDHPSAIILPITP